MKQTIFETRGEKCINFNTTTTISNKFKLHSAFLELIRQLDLGEVTDINLDRLDGKDYGYIFFTGCDGIRYTLEIVDTIYRTMYYQINFSLYK